MRISVVVNTKNEEQALERCLRSAAWADEIVVLDMSSDDETVAVARRYTDRVYSCPDFGYVEPARNLAVSHATGDWVFVLDADEVIPPRLAANVRRIVAESGEYALVAIPRRNYIGNYAIKNSGWGADYQPRLYRRGHLTWNDGLHSWPQVEGATRYLSPDSGYYIKHYNYEDLSDFVERLNRYTSIEAGAAVTGGGWANWRDILKEVMEEFGKRYTPKEDGFYSLALAGSMAFYRFIARCKQLEQIREAEGDVVFPLPDSLEEIAAEALTHLPSGLPETLAGARQLKSLEEESARARDAYEAQIEHLNGELARTRDRYEARLAIHESQLAGQAAQLGAREAEVRRLSEELAGARLAYDEQEARLQNELAGCEARAARLSGQLEQLSATLSGREAEMKQQVASLVKLRAGVEKREEVLEWIYTSRPWRIASVLWKLQWAKHQWRHYGVSVARGLRLPVRPRFHGLIETPTEAANVAGELEINGWVFSTTAAVTLVEAFLDDFYLGRLSYGIRRADVAASYSEHARAECGYSERVTLGAPMVGRRKLIVRVYDADGNTQIYTRFIVVGSHRTMLPSAPASANGKGARAAVAAPAGAAADPNFYSQVEALVNQFRGRMERDPSILNWNTGLNLAAALPQVVVFSPPYTNGHYVLPYLDRSVDIVVVSGGDPRQLAEAHRVASAAVVRAHGVDAAHGRRAPGSGAAKSRIRLEAEWKEGVVGEGALPGASIVIPVYNKVEYTEKCLAQLFATLPHNFRGEIIVVDDASSDATPEALARWARKDDRITVLRNERNQGFIHSCNRGAEAARGEVLVFLNNDTLPQPGWLPPLLRVFRERPDAGAVGGKLLYPDGTLQEAGGIIFSDASGCNFGRKDKSPHSPLYSFLREVDYCSGALLATPRALFLSLGGFDTRYAPAYYEDTDYCFSLREAGRKVYYQPESVIIHFEGVSSGTDIRNGVKSHQATNRGKFMEKWRHVLERHPAPPSRYDFATLHALSVREEVRGADAN